MIIILILLAFFQNVPWGAIRGTIVGVYDGDTIDFLTTDGQNFRIRLDYIDAPELSQKFGIHSKIFVSTFLKKDCLAIIRGKDKYGRHLAIIKLKDSTILQELILSTGLAWHYKKYNNSPKLDSIEKKARYDRRGLWYENNPTPPWKFRRNR